MSINKTGVLMESLDGGVCVIYSGIKVGTGIPEVLVIPVFPRHVQKERPNIGYKVEFETVCGIDEKDFAREFAIIKGYLL
jgi:hypothetical protein